MKPNGFVSKGIHGLVLVVTIFSISGFGIFVPTLTAEAANTGYKSPTANASNNSGSGDDWSDAHKAYSNGSGYAYEENSERHRYYDFGFSVPSGSTINGIEVKVDAWSTDNSGCKLGVDLSWNAGSNWVTEKSVNLTGSEATYALGATNDAWGRTWQASDFSNANFRARVHDIDPGSSCSNERTTKLDWIRILVDYTTPPATISAKKIMCDNESDLPDWADGAADITASTAADYITSHEGCYLVDWDFQWAPDGTANPGDNTGAASGAWSTFTNTTTVDATQNSTVWIREIWDANYIPFSGDTSVSADQVDSSAEIYCSTDVLNYDNYDYISGLTPGQTYHCVAFNVAAPFCGDGMVNQDSEQCESGDTQPCTTNEGYAGTQSCFMGNKTADLSDQQPWCTWENTCVPTEYCGDETVNGPEQCDDGNEANGDGCSSSCTIEEVPTYDLHGYKWQDVNANWEQDGDEAKLGGWTIFIDENENGILDGEEQSTQTATEGDHFGWYWFEDLPEGNYRVCEVIQDGWQQTYPHYFTGSDCWDVTLPDQNLFRVSASLNAVEAYDYNFGNRLEGDLAIEKSVLVNEEESTVANEGDILSYTIKVTNSGDEPEYNLYVQDTTPTNTTLVNPSGDLATATFSGDTFKWGPFDLLGGEEKTFTFYATVNAELPVGTTEIENQATLWQMEAQEIKTEARSFFHQLLGIKTANAQIAPTLTLIATSNIVLTTVTIDEPETPETPENPEEPGIVAGDETEPKLTITKTAEHEFVNPGDTLAYTIVVKNTGDGSALNVTVKDTLPADFTFSDQSTTKTWDLGTIAAGAEQKVIYDVTISKEALEGYYENIAVASADNHEDVGAVAAVDVRKPAVLGDSIPDTGASSMDYVIFSISFMMIASGVYLINRKPLFVKRTIK